MQGGTSENPEKKSGKGNTIREIAAAGAKDIRSLRTTGLPGAENLGMPQAPSLHGGTRRDEGSGHADVHSLMEVYVVSLKQSQAEV